MDDQALTAFAAFMQANANKAPAQINARQAPKKPSYCTKSNERVLEVVKAANSLDHPLAKHTHGQKGKCEKALKAQIMVVALGRQNSIRRPALEPGTPYPLVGLHCCAGLTTRPLRACARESTRPCSSPWMSPGFTAGLG